MKVRRARDKGRGTTHHLARDKCFSAALCQSGVGMRVDGDGKDRSGQAEEAERDDGVEAIHLVGDER